MTVIALATLLVCQQQPTQTYDVVFRYFFKAKAEPTGLKVEFQKVKGVQSVTFDVPNRLATVRYNGVLKDFKKLTDAAGADATIVSHFPLAMTFKPMPGSRGDIIDEELKRIKGTDPAGLKISGTNVEIMADLRTVTYGSLVETARNASFEFQVRTPVWFEVTMAKGDIPKVTALLERETGVLASFSDRAAKKVSLWAVPRTLTEDRIKELVEGAGATIEKIYKP